jgi:hypothetical protein
MQAKKIEQFFFAKTLELSGFCDVQHMSGNKESKSGMTEYHASWLAERADLTRMRRLGHAGAYSECVETRMAKLALIYGLRLLPEEDLAEVRDATVVLKNGKTARVAMHLIEGSKEEIEATFHQSVEAFFEMYPEI